MPLVVAICAKEPQLAPEQRSMRYPVMPTLSVAGLQVNVTCVLEVAAVTRFIGAVGELRLGAAGAVEFGALGVFTDALQP